MEGESLEAGRLGAGVGWWGLALRQDLWVSLPHLGRDTATVWNRGHAKAWGPQAGMCGHAGRPTCTHVWREAWIGLCMNVWECMCWKLGCECGDLV